MNRKMKQEKLAKQISLALMAGMVTYTPVAFGMPVQDGTAAGVTVTRPNDVTMNITGDNPTNVINWVDFSIAKDEFVNFTNTNNYANIVTGSATSFIDGHMNGGGDIYLINPNGVIFGKDAQVNVGNLYVSTQGLANGVKEYDQIVSKVKGPIETNVASDVVNLGGLITANKVEVVGNNIRFLNAENIHADSVTIKTDGYVHLGHAATVEATTYDEGDVKEYAAGNDNASLIDGKTVEDIYTAKDWDGYSVKKLDNTTRADAIDNYLLVRNEYELQNIQGNAAANYMLADDINKGVTDNTPFTPISDFSGNFDGMFYTVNNLNISGGGVFASTSGTSVRIENAGFVNVSVNNSEQNTGGIVGSAGATNTLLRNVYTTGGSVTGGDTDFTGGLVGYAAGTGTLKIESSYNSNSVVGASGILGTYDDAHIVMEDVYNMSSNVHYGLLESRGMGGSISVNRAYTTSGQIAYNKSGMSNWYDSANTPDWNSDSVKIKSKYSGWGSTISDVGGVSVDSSGNVTKPTWRIYAGQSLPMLTAFFKGTVQADYTYSMGNSVSDYSNFTSNDTIGISSDKGNVTAVYNGGTVHTGIDALKNLTDEQKALISYAGDKKDAEKSQDGLDKDNNYALFYSTQQGYDIAGSNFTITKRKVIADSSADIVPTKEYDGTSSVNVTGGDIGGTFQATTGKTGIITGDDVTLTGNVSGKFYISYEKWKEWHDAGEKPEDEPEVLSKNVGTGKYAILSYDTLSLSGADAKNYEVEINAHGDIASKKGVITPRSLTVDLNNKDGATKVYDGTTTVTTSGYGWEENVSLDKSRVLGTEVVNLDTSSVPVVAYADKNAGTGKTLSYTGIKLTGADAGNYQLVDASGHIIYNATGVGPEVNPEGATLTATGEITRRTINMATALEAATREYDGTTTYDGTVNLDTDDFVLAGDTSKTTGIIKYNSGSHDAVGFALKEGTTGTFKDSGGNATSHATGTNAATSIAYTLIVSGEDASNYVVAGTDLDEGTELDVVGSGTITKATLTAAYNTAKDPLVRTYNGNSVVEDGTEIPTGTIANGSYITVSGWKTAADETALANTVVSGADYVTNGVANGHVAFANDQVQKKDIKFMLGTLDDYKYEDANGNEITSITAANAGKITQKAVTVNFAEINKTYDGTTALTAANLTTVKNNSTLEGVLAADAENVTLNTDNLQGVYKSKNVADYAGADGKVGAVTYTNVSVTDATDNHDYIVPSGEMHGNGYITAKTLTGTADDFGIGWKTDTITKTYDGNDKVKGTTGYESDVYGTDAVTATNFINKLYAAGVTDGDPIAFKVATAVYDNKNAGGTTSKAVTYTLKIDKSQFSLDSNYDVSGMADEVTITKATTGTITPKVITASISNAHETTKTYDGTSSVVDANGDVVTDGTNLVTLDGLVSSVDTNNSTAAYHYLGTGVNTETKNATQNSVNGANKIVYDIIIDDGNGGNNYVVKDSSGNTVTQLTGDGIINKAALSLAFTEPVKDYDTTTAATVSVTPTGLQGTDALDTDSITGTYGKGTSANWEADANAGTDKLVKYTGIDTALGDNYGNYNVTYGSGDVVNGVAYSSGTINKLTLTSDKVVSDIAAVTKTYDGTANVNHFDGSTTKTASDYFGLKVTINGQVQDWKNSATKTYFKTVTGTYKDSALNAGDAKNAGTNKTVTYTVELADNLAANIILDPSALTDKLTTTNNVINKRQVDVSVSTTTPIDKVYDGTTDVLAASVPISYEHNADINTSITGILASDYNDGSGVTVSTTGSEYTSADANWDPTVASTHDGSNTVSLSLSLNNNTNGNYELTSGSAQAAGNIQKKALTVSIKADADLDKDYDATKNLENQDATTYLDLNGSVISGDTVALSGASGSYDSKNAGDRTVTFKDFAVNNTNYYVSTTSLNGAGTIAQKVIDTGKVKLNNAGITKTYDGSADATSIIVGKTLTSDAFINGDTVTLTATGATYNAATVAGATTVTYSGVSIGGTDAANYTITGTTLTGDGTITPKTIHAGATGTVTGKTYDGQELSLADLNIQLNSADIVTKAGTTTPDNVALTGTISATKGGSPVEKIKDAGDYALSYDNFSLNGADANNYTLSLDTTKLPQNVTIAKKMLTADVASGAYREYVAGNNVTNDVNVTLSGFVADSDYSVTADDKVTTIVGTYGKWDATNGFTGDNNVSRSTTTTNYVPVEGKNYGYKAINYGGFDTAVTTALGTASADAAKNYYVGNVTGNGTTATMTKDDTGLVQTAYFKEAAKMGHLTPISITAASIKEKWSDIEKVYDGTTSVNNPLEKFTLYYDANGNNQQDTNEGSIAYKIAEGGSTVYNSADVATANTVTYRGVKVDENTALTDNPNYEMASDIFNEYNGAIDDTHAKVTDGTTKVAINKRGLIVQPTTNAPSKVYDGTTAVENASNYVTLVTTKSGDTGVIEGDDVLLDTSGITGAYDTMDGGENKDVTYSGLALTGTKAGNYKVINSEGTATDTITGKGKITPREIEVAIKNRDVQKVYDSTSDVLKDNDDVTVNQAFKYSTDAADTDGKNLVTATVTGGQITYDTANNKIIYTPTAGTGVVEVQLEKATFTKDGTATANAGTGLGIDYVLSYDPKNIVLVHTTADGDKISLTPAENSRMSATLRGDNIGTITQREIKLNNIYAEKIYDGTDAVKGFNGDNITVHDMHKNVDFAQGKLLGDDTVNGLGITVTGGTYDDPNAADDETQEKKDHTVSGVTFTINNGNYKLVGAQPTDGTGVINRKTITANPTTVKTAPGETPTFSGSFSGFVGDDGAQAAQDFEWKSDSYPDKISEKGSYEVHAWYTNGNRRDGNYGKNYTFSTPTNTAWTVGYTDPLDPSNPDSPFNPDNPMNPSNPGSPLNPNSDAGQAISQASKFKPDDKSYNRASHDDNIEHFGQQSSISIQYEDTGVNVGDEEAVVGKRSLIGIESAGNVVNLGDAEMHAGSIGIESNGVNLGPTAEQAAIEAGLPATESYEAVPAVTTAEQEDAVVESPFLSRLRQGQSAASDESNNGEVSTGISIITADPEDEDEEEKKNRAALMARSDRETHIGIETIGSGVNMAAAAR